MTSVWTRTERETSANEEERGELGTPERQFNLHG